jgi:hypothetical protein
VFASDAGRTIGAKYSMPTKYSLRVRKLFSDAEQDAVDLKRHEIRLEVFPWVFARVMMMRQQQLDHLIVCLDHKNIAIIKVLTRDGRCAVMMLLSGSILLNDTLSPERDLLGTRQHIFIPRQYK